MGQLVKHNTNLYGLNDISVPLFDLKYQISFPMRETDYNGKIVNIVYCTRNRQQNLYNLYIFRKLFELS